MCSAKTQGGGVCTSVCVCPNTKKKERMDFWRYLTVADIYPSIKLKTYPSFFRKK